MQVSSVQLNKTSPAHCFVHPAPQATSLSPRTAASSTCPCRPPALSTSARHLGRGLPRHPRWATSQDNLRQGRNPDPTCTTCPPQLLVVLQRRRKKTTLLGSHFPPAQSAPLAEAGSGPRGCSQLFLCPGSPSAGLNADNIAQ